MFFTLRRDPKGLRRDQHVFLLLLQDLAGSRRSLEKVKRQDGEKLQRQVKFLKACSFAFHLELRIFETERLDLKFIFLTPRQRFSVLQLPQACHIILIWPLVLQSWRLKFGERGLHSTKIAYLLLIRQPRVRFSAFPIIFLLMLLRFIEGTT